MKIKQYFLLWKLSLIAAICVHIIFLRESFSEHLQLLAIDICLLLFLRNLSRIENREQQLRSVATLICTSLFLGIAHALIIILGPKSIHHVLGIMGNIGLVILGYKCIWDARGENEMLLLFDGDCGFCNRTIKMVLKNNDLKNIKFSPLQSDFSKKWLLKFNLLEDYRESSVFIAGDEVFLNENSGFRIARELNIFFVLLYPMAMLFPRFISRKLYRWIANNRYKFFGASDQCMVLDQETQKRFL